MSDIWGGFEATLESGGRALHQAVSEAGDVLAQAGLEATERLEQEADAGLEAVSGFAQSALGSAGELAGASQAAASEAQQRLQDELMPALGDAVRSLLEADLPGLGDALRGSCESLGVGLEVAASMAAFAPPLEWARGIVGTIGDLLEAMALGL